jgi:hypothetical protein
MCRERERAQTATLAALQARIAASGGGTQRFVHTLARMDTAGHRRLQLDEVHLALRYCAVQPSPEELAVLQAAAGTTKCGEVATDTLLAQLAAAAAQ